MNSKYFLYLSGSLLFPSSLCKAQVKDAVATTDRPNVIYLLCDDMGYSDIEAYGQQMISTPNLTKTRAAGNEFHSILCKYGCKCSFRASLMTGQHTGHTKIRGNKEIQPEGQEPLDPEVKH